MWGPAQGQRFADAIENHLAENLLLPRSDFISYNACSRFFLTPEFARSERIPEL
jgi:hypothetical protein